MTNRKMVITSGAGFISTNLAKGLVANNSVIIIGNLSAGEKENLTVLLRENVKFVFHQAAISSVPKSIADPLATNETNVTGTSNVLLVATDNSVKKIIFTPSTAAYEDTPTLLQEEEMIPNPQSPIRQPSLVETIGCLRKERHVNSYVAL